jgi:hypothetical protein
LDDGKLNELANGGRIDIVQKLLLEWTPAGEEAVNQERSRKVSGAGTGMHSGLENRSDEDSEANGDAEVKGDDNGKQPGN